MEFKKKSLYSPMFPNQWTPIKLYELAEWINGKAFKKDDYNITGLPVIKIAELNTGLSSNTKYSINNDEKFYIKKGDILFAWSGNPDTSIDTHKFKEKEGYLNQHIFKVLPNDNKIESDFLYYILKYLKPFFKEIARNKQTTGLGHVTISDLKKIQVRIPSKNIQKEIADIFIILDSKIEINNKIISNLESQAQTIFKSWFVDFEPFQDGEFVESELGMIPEGWEVKSLSDIAFFKNGLAMQKYRPEINDPSLPVLKIRELNSGSTDFSSDRCRTDIDDSVKVYDGDLIFSWSGTLSCKLWTGGNAGLNQHLFKVTSEKYEKWFNYSWVKSHMNEFIRIAQDKATTMGHIKRSHLDEAKVLIPTIDIYEKIDKLMKPIIELIIKLGIQNTKLAELRDALLPKLMAGEIDVSNIKIEGEEVKNE